MQSRKLLLLSGLLLAFMINAFGSAKTATWSSLTPGLTENDALHGIYFIDDSKGFAVGSNSSTWKGIILTTTDGGTSWTSTEKEKSLQKVYFINSTTGFIIGAQGYLLKTTDAGVTWTEKTSNTTSGLQDIHFPTATTGYISVPGGKFLKTTDAGETWTELTITDQSGWTNQGIYFTSETTGYIVGDDRIVVKTSDGGTTWTEQRDDGYSSFYDVWFTDANKGFAVGNSYYYTTDGGTTWTFLEEGKISTGAYDIHFLDADKGFQVGGAKILKTVNGGTNWTIETTPDISSTTLYSVHFPSSTIGYACGSKGTILKYSETASTLSAQFSTDVTSGNAPLTVQFTDASTGTPTTWSWDFDNDGTEDASTQNPSYIYNTAGTFTAKLTVGDGTITDDTVMMNYIVVTVEGEITSIAEGGNWNETTTWIGGVVPTAADDVIIDGLVFVNRSVECNNLTINTDATLQKIKDNTTRTLTINGDLVNNGTMMKDKNELYSYIFQVNVSGNITNAGTIFYVYTKFNGSTDQYIATTATSVWEDGRIEDSDSSTAIIAASSLYFHDDLLIRLNDSNNKYCSIIIPKDSGFNIYGKGTVQFDKLNIFGNGNELHLSNKAQLWSYVNLKNISIHGNAIIVDDINFIDSVINMDTISNESAISRYFNAYGTFTNMGLIIGTSTTSTVRASIYGNIINEGSWENCRVDIEGVDDQTITLNNNSTIGSKIRIFANVDGASTYQWKKDEVDIELATSYMLELDSLYAATEGKYTCTTDVGESRIMLLGAAGSAPTIAAAFSTDKTSGEAPLTVTFTDESTGNPTMWSWDFDNNGSEETTAQNPEYTFTTPGTYTVKLVASKEGNYDIEIKTDYITVTGGSETLDAEFSADVTSGDAPLAVTFTDASTGTPTTWSWDFDNDGSVDATTQNPTYTYETAGTYTVSLTVGDGVSTSNEVKTDYITVNAIGFDCLDPTDYSTDFENDDDYIGWSFYDANEDGHTWNFYNESGVDGSIAAGCEYSPDNAANDWLYSPCFEMIEGKNYEISFFYAVGDPDYPEKLKLMYGTDKSTGLNKTVVDLGEINNATFTESTTTISITESGKYSFGWYCYSDANKYYVLFDNISIKEKLNSSVSNPHINEELFIYPNPSSGIVNIAIDNNEPTILSVYDLGGVMIMQKEVNVAKKSEQIDLRKLNKGLYIIKTTSNGCIKVGRLMVN